MTYRSTIIIRKEGKWFVARSLELGVTSQGRTIDDAKSNLREAIELFLEDAPKSRKELINNEAPLVTSLEVTNRG